VITWQRSKELLSDLVSTAEDLGVEHPITRASILPESPRFDKNAVLSMLEDVFKDIEIAFKADWDGGTCFLVARSRIVAETAERCGWFWRYVTLDGTPLWALLQQRIILETYANHDDLSLMVLSIGPVQEFIAEARKVRDLWAGSYILASASFNAAVPFLRSFGPDVVLHPHVHESTLFAKWLCRQYDCPELTAPASVQRMASIPNKLLAVVPFDLVDSLGQEAVACVKEQFWGDLGKAVWENNRRQFGYLVNEPHWTAQIADHFHLHFTAVPVSKKELVKTFRESHHRGNELFESRKLTRSFPPWPAGLEREKCTLCAHREVLGPELPEARRDFWRGMVRKGRGRLRTGESLCAVCYTKRMVSEITLDVPKTPFESTVDIALKGYRERLRSENHEDLLAAADLLRETLGLPDGERIRDLDGMRGEWFIKDQLLSFKFLESIAPERAAFVTAQRPLPEEIHHAIACVVECLDELQRRIGPPPRYFGLLMMDGDYMGRWMSGDWPDPHKSPMTLTRHTILSATMGAMGKEVFPTILNESNWSGVVVYSGGDDLLAIGPMEGILQFADDARKAFTNGAAERCVGLGEGASISGAVVFAHCHDHLGKVLEVARESLQRSKELLGRNALSIAVRLASGSSIVCGSKWEMPLSESLESISLAEFLMTLAAWMGRESDGLSPRFIQNLMESTPVFYARDGKELKLHSEAYSDEVKRLLKRHLPVTSSLWQNKAPYSVDQLPGLLSYLGAPSDHEDAFPRAFRTQKEENFLGLLKVALFLYKERGEQLHHGHFGVS
jgi:CRISPR-associated protein Cmr2